MSLPPTPNQGGPARPRLPRRAGRIAARALPLVALLLGVTVLADRLQGVEIEPVIPALAALAPVQWIGALLLTAISLWAVGQYDVVLHRAMASGVAPDRARKAGTKATALAQTIGFGSLTGALVRWRSLPDCDLWTVTRLSLLVTLSFFAALGLVVAVVTLSRSGDWIAAATVMALAGLLINRLGPLPGLPELRPGTALRLIFWTALDTCAAGLVLWLLLPSGLAVPVGAVVTAYLLALGAGLLSQSPGGVGAFELCLLGLLPQVPDPALMSAIIGYRIIYHLLPAGIALLLLIRPGQPMPRPALLLADAGPRLRALARAPHSEWGLAHQGADILMTRDHESGWLVRRAGATLVAIGKPLGAPALSALADHAARLGLAPALYKCSATTAARARRAGWHVARIAEEAILDPQTWRLDTPACRGLRRKLRSAAAAEVTIEVAPHCLPMAEMARVAAAWAQRSGGERGFSMGRFAPDLLHRQMVLLAWQDGLLVGFASFHQGRQDWSLDMMRQRGDAPDGTMMALLVAAIEAARNAGIEELSLAALPLPPAWLPARLRPRYDAWAGSPGLARFKHGFGPGYRPLYMAAPSRAGLLRAAVEIGAAIHRPAPLDAMPRLPDIELRAQPVQNGADTARRPFQLPVFRGRAPRHIDPTGPAHDRRAFPTSRNP